MNNFNFNDCVEINQKTKSIFINGKDSGLTFSTKSVGMNKWKTFIHPPHQTKEFLSEGFDYGFYHNTYKPSDSEIALNYYILYLKNK